MREVFFLERKLGSFIINCQILTAIMLEGCRLLLGEQKSSRVILWIALRGKCTFLCNIENVKLYWRSTIMQTFIRNS